MSAPAEIAILISLNFSVIMHSNLFSIHRTHFGRIWYKIISIQRVAILTTYTLIKKAVGKYKVIFKEMGKELGCKRKTS